MIDAAASDVTDDPGMMAAGIIYAANHGAQVIDISQNASAYPVPASAPNPVYAKYRAWLATRQGRPVSRPPSVSRSPAAAAPSAVKGGSAPCQTPAGTPSLGRLACPRP